MENPLVTPDPGLFFWTIATFLVLLGLLTKFAWKPLLAALERREQLIARAVDDAEKARREVERVQQESTLVLAQARQDAEAMVSRTRADAGRFHEELRQKAVADAAAIVHKAEREIELEKNRALEQIRREAVDLSVTIASKVISRNLSKDDNLALIEDTIKQIQTSSSH